MWNTWPRWARQSRVWIPRDLSSCVFWAPNEFATAAQWSDLVGGRHLVQASGSLQPTVDAGPTAGTRSLSFNGTSQYLSSGNCQIFAGTYTMAVVAKCGATGGGSLISHGNHATGVQLLESTNRIVEHAGVADLADGAVSTSAWEVWVASCNGTSTTLTVNGSAQSLTSSTSLPIAPASTSKIVTGALWRQGTTAYQTFALCRVAEIVICNAALGASDMDRLTRYLRAKFAL